MDKLSSNERSFIAMMGESDEHASKGFELILKRPVFLRYFDPLIESGFFDPSRNPAPIFIEASGQYHVPYWKALDYLLACAECAGRRSDHDLSGKIMRIVKSVSRGCKCSDACDNHRTFHSFAEILGLLPVESIRADDLNLIPMWLNTRFDRSLVAHALIEGVLKRFLGSLDSSVLENAVKIVEYCTTIQWRTSDRESHIEEPNARIDVFWFKELVDRYASILGEKAGCGAATLLAARVCEVFGRGRRAKWSQLFRPAVEEDDQNTQFNSLDNCVVVALRDVLLAWFEVDAATATPFVESLLRSDNEMLRRIGIYLIRTRWDELRKLYVPVVTAELFGGGHLHELYGLLRARFEMFDCQEKQATIKAIRNLAYPEGTKDGIRERIQRDWLSAVAGTTYTPAAKWLAELTKSHGPPSSHPDYLSYHESRWGHGPSGYSVPELIASAREHDIVRTLSTFEPGDAWNGPTVMALVHDLERAVDSDPAQFAEVLPDFLDAPRPFQYAVISGYFKSWRGSGGDGDRVNKDRIWTVLFEFFERLLNASDFWAREPASPVTNGADWRDHAPSPISDVIADLLTHGTRNDESAYPISFLPRAWSLIQILLKNAQRVTEPSDDPMRQAINSPKGRALDAAFNHILRRCRLADRESDSHAAVWSEVCRLVDRELRCCNGDNFEFSTLCGAYLRHLAYLDMNWLRENIGRIFPRHHRRNLICALAGLSYATVDRDVLRMLRDEGVIDLGLRLEHQSRYSREKLLEKLMLGYLWGDDVLCSPRFTYLFEVGCMEDFESINNWLRHIRGENLNTEQLQRVTTYWRRCLQWTRSLAEPPRRLLARMSGLTAFLETAEGNDDLLIAVAPHVPHGDIEVYGFIRELSRLASESPTIVCDVVVELIDGIVDSGELFYDYKDWMQKLLRCLSGTCRDSVIEFCEKLRSVDGLAALYNELSA